MAVRLRDAIAVGNYVTDGRRLLRVLSIAGSETLCEDARTLQAEGFRLPELEKGWRRVRTENESKVQPQ